MCSDGVASLATHSLTFSSPLDREIAIVKRKGQVYPNKLGTCPPDVTVASSASAHLKLFLSHPAKEG